MTGNKNAARAGQPPTLKVLAENLGLSPATISIVLNNPPMATSIPAAHSGRHQKFAYRPNLHARILRSRLTNTIGIIAPELPRRKALVARLGYPPVRDLLSRTRDFTAIFCSNDTSAIGAIRASRPAGLACPHDISVIGFDDIIVAEYFNPRLTTLLQPLYKMGSVAAEFLINRIQSPDEPYPQDVWFEPELIVRESTMGVPKASPPRPSRGRR